MAVGCGYFGFGNRPVCAVTPQQKGGDAERYQVHFGVGDGYAGPEFIPIDYFPSKMLNDINPTVT